MTIWLVVLFLECAFVELLQTERAHEMLWMELAEHGGDAAACDGFRAASTKRSTFGMIMRFTVRCTFMIEERTIVERLTAVLEQEETPN